MWGNFGSSACALFWTPVTGIPIDVRVEIYDTAVIFTFKETITTMKN